MWLFSQQTTPKSTGGKMNRPKVVNLVLEDLGADAEPIEKYIVDLEQERDQLKSQNESLWETLFQVAEMLNIDYEWARKQGGKPSDVYRKCLVEHDAEVIEKFLNQEAPRIDPDIPIPLEDQHCCENTLYQERERIHAAANQLLQKAQENPE